MPVRHSGSCHAQGPELRWGNAKCTRVGRQKKPSGNPEGFFDFTCFAYLVAPPEPPRSSSEAWAAASRAVSTRKGEQET